jgi:iron complex outermembrane receptor protein
MHSDFTQKLILMAAGTLLAAPAAMAQDLALEEVLVTAQKREQSLEDVPLSVSSITGESVNDYLSGAQDIRALAARVPGLNIETSNGRTQPRFYLRGLGNIDFDVNANQPVAMVFDDIYLENNTLRSIPLFDLERIEVLKGPQGSLFGRNTNAGAIAVHSVRPSDERRGYFRAAAGSRGNMNFEAASNFSLADDMNMRVSVKHQQRDKWIDNVINGEGFDYGGFEETAFRLQFGWSPNDSFQGLFKLHGFDQDGSDPNVFYANAIAKGAKGVRSGFNPRAAFHDDDVATMRTHHRGAALNLEWALGEDRMITSITGYDTLENFQSADVDGGTVSFNPADRGELGKQIFFGVATGDGLTDHEQFTQEVRFSGNGDNLFYQMGLYYFDEDFDLLNYNYLVPNDSALVNQKTTSYAVFGQAEWSLSDSLSLTVGARWTDDEKDLTVDSYFSSGNVLASAISVDDDFFNWDVALSWDMNEDWTWYGRVATGSRGPVTLGRFGFTSSAKTEDSTALEVGFKSTLMDGRARWNSALYSYTNDDHQLTATGGTANVNRLLNADKVNGWGFESELEVQVTEKLFIAANVSYNDTEIDDSNLKDEVCSIYPGTADQHICTWTDPYAGTRDTFFGPAVDVFIDGNPLPRTPEWIYNLILEYTHPMGEGDLYFNTDWSYRDESNLFLYEAVEFVQDERWLGGLRMGYRHNSGWDMALVGRNVTDEIVVEGAIDFLNATAFVNEPRYWGVELGYNF